MREIKFRAKRIDNGEWVYGCYFVTPLTDENSGVGPEAGWYFLSDGKKRHCISDESGVVHVVDPETLGQYTGLKDKLRKEIYEDSILEDWQDLKYIIRFAGGSFWMESDYAIKLLTKSVISSMELVEVDSKSEHLELSSKK